jgi:hypothetical protein
MGIDLIEQSEMTALSPNRFSSGKNFIDENSYSNANGKFRSKAWNRYIRETQAKINERFRVDPKLKDNCEYLKLRLSEVQNELESVLSQNPNNQNKEAKVKPLRENETNYKNLLLRNQCAEIREQKEKEETKKETLETLSAVASTPPPMLPQDEKSSNTTKYIIYGVGGIIVLVGIVLLFKKSN